MTLSAAAIEAADQIEALWKDGYSVATIRKKVLSGRPMEASVLAYIEGYLAAVIRRAIA